MNSKILIDSRSLFDRHKGGITVYTETMVRSLLSINDGLEYFFLQNNWHDRNANIVPRERIVNYPLPSKIFNLSTILTQIPKVDQSQKYKLVWQPSFNFLSVSDKCQYVITVHDLTFLINKKWFDCKRRLWHNLQRVEKVLARANHIVTVSENTKQDLNYFFKINSNKITVISSGVSDTYENNELSAIRFSVPQRFFLYYGTIEPRKNIIAIIQSWQRLVKDPKYHDVHLVIGGALGWGMQNYVNTYFHKHIPHLHYLNYLNTKDKNMLIDRCLALIWPSFYEGFGFPVIEVLKSQKAVITSYSSSIPEVTKNRALLVNPYNINDLVLAMKSVLENESVIFSISNDGLLKEYQWTETARKYSILFQQLIKNI